MAKFEQDVMDRLARIEKAVEIMVSRIASLETECSKRTGRIWSELRRSGEKLRDECSTNRKEVERSRDKFGEQIEGRLKERLERLEEDLSEFEEKVFAVEKDVSLGETRTKDVFSIQEKLGSLANCVTANKVKIKGIETALMQLDRLEKKFDARGWRWAQTVFTGLSVLVAAGALLFMVLREVLSR